MSARTKTGRTRPAVRASVRVTLTAALATLLVAGVSLLAAPTRASAAIMINDTTPELGKSATNLDKDYESEVALSVSDANTVHDLVIALDASSSGFAECMANGGLATYLERLDLSQGGSVRIGLVLFGTKKGGAQILLSLTPYNEDRLNEITNAFNEAAQATEGSANLEAAIALADQMLDDALVETGGSGDYQTLAIVTDGMTTSWGVEQQQTFYYAGGTNEPTDDLLRKRKPSIDSILLYEVGDGGYDPLTWMNKNDEQIEQDIAEYANKEISADNASEVTTSLEAGGYRASLRLRSLLTSNNHDGRRKYVIVFDKQGGENPEDIGYCLRHGLLKSSGQKPDDHFQYVPDATDFDFAVRSVLDQATMPGMSNAGAIVDVIGQGTDDGHGNPYDFSFVSEPSTLSLTIGDTAYAVASCTPGDKFSPMGGTLPSDVTVYTFGMDPAYAGYSVAELYYCPNGLGMLSGTSLDGLYTPLLSDGNTQDECFVLKWTYPMAPYGTLRQPTVELSYRVRLENPQVSPGTYGTYDEDGSKEQEHETLLTNKSACFAFADELPAGKVYEFPKPTVSYEVQPAVVRPADITVYMGGSDGYSSVLTGEAGSGDVVTEESGSLPEPGFYVTLPDEANKALEAAGEHVDGEAADLSSYVTVRTQDGPKTWTLEAYGDTHSGAYDRFVYRIVAADGQDPVRLQFTDDEGTRYVSDDFDPAALGSLSRDLSMSIYPGDVDLDKILMDVTVGSETLTYVVRTEPATLRVRVVNDEQGDAVTDVLTGEDAQVPSDGRAYASVPQGTRFLINGSEIDVTDEAAPSLLFDSVVSDDNTEGARDYETALMGRATDELGSFGALSDPSYEARYLDLVDANNGNTWLRATNPVTVYWPYPEGTDESTEFCLAHFAGLNREIALDDLDAAVAAAPIEEIEVENTPYGIRFTTNGFSPFVLAWDAEGSTALPATGDPTTTVWTALLAGGALLGARLVTRRHQA